MDLFQTNSLNFIAHCVIMLDPSQKKFYYAAFWIQANVRPGPWSPAVSIKSHLKAIQLTHCYQLQQTILPSDPEHVPVLHLDSGNSEGVPSSGPIRIHHKSETHLHCYPVCSHLDRIKWVQLILVPGKRTKIGTLLELIGLSLSFIASF